MIQAALWDDLTDRERVLAHYRDAHPAYIAHLRALAIDFARRIGSVTTDDLRAEMQRLATPSPEDLDLDPRIMGSVLRGCPGLVPCGHRTSDRPTARNLRAGWIASQIVVYRVVTAEDAA